MGFVTNCWYKGRSYVLHEVGRNIKKQFFVANVQ